MERGLVIVKPHVLRRPDAATVIGDIIQRFGNAGLCLIQIKKYHLSKAEASRFYEVHKERPFFEDLIERSSSGPSLVMVIGGEGKAILTLRDLVGARDPRCAERGTIRADYAENIFEYAVHVADCVEAAQREINFFFPETELLG